MDSDSSTPRLWQEIDRIVRGTNAQQEEGRKRLMAAGEEYLRLFIQQADQPGNEATRRVVQACRSAIPEAGKRLGEIFIATADRKDNPDEPDLRIAGLGYLTFLLATKGQVEPLDVATALVVGYRAGQRHGG